METITTILDMNITNDIPIDLLLDFRNELKSIDSVEALIAIATIDEMLTLKTA
jgi:hypothetical protein